MPEEDFALPDHAGQSYKVVLGRLHQTLSPRRYLEIGTLNGITLELANCASLAIDPRFKIETNVIGKKPVCLFYQCGSDDFFRDYNPQLLLGGTIDLAFLDGMHWFEFLLRDFINTERHCHPTSVIAVHDCLPTDPHVARRVSTDGSLTKKSTHAGWWAGDVWKAIAMIKRYRPELRIIALDADPTGLVLITNLDPASRVLSERYFEVVEAARDLQLNTAALRAYFDTLGVQSTKTLGTADQISAHFYF